MAAVVLPKVEDTFKKTVDISQSRSVDDVFESVAWRVWVIIGEDMGSCSRDTSMKKSLIIYYVNESSQDLSLFRSFTCRNRRVFGR